MVLAGKGGNGGGALVAARHLSNMGCTIHVCLNTHPENLSGAPARQLDILRQMGVPVFSDIKNLSYVPTQIIDGLIGYSLMGAPRGRTAELINWTGNCPAPVISLDLPSGLEADSGEKLHPCINARYVMTLALPKTGLKTWLDSDIDRRLYLADIGVPPVLYHDAFGLNVPFIFQSSHIVEIIR